VAEQFSPFTDLGYTAYLRALGVEEAALGSELRRRQSAAQRQFIRDASGLQAQAEKAYRTERDSLVERGALASSQAVRNLSGVVEDFGRRGLELAAGLQENQEATTFDAVSRISQLRRDALERDFAARQRATEAGNRSIYGG